MGAGMPYYGQITDRVHAVIKDIQSRMGFTQWNSILLK